MHDEKLEGALLERFCSEWILRGIRGQRSSVLGRGALPQIFFGWQRARLISGSTHKIGGFAGVVRKLVEWLLSVLGTKLILTIYQG